MSKKTIKAVSGSTVVWENLEQFVRGRIQSYVQDLLEEEVITSPRSGELGGC